MDNTTNENMVSLKIDGIDFKAPRGTPILKIARENGIYIPSMCYHEEVSPYGVCRLCLVEVFDGKRKRIREACTYPALDGIEVFTKSEKILKQRKVIMELILARSYNNPVVHQVAREMGITDTRFKKQEKPCIMCGLCVRTCEEIVGVSALGFVERGATRQIGTPFFKPSATCIGCGACATMCPAQCIEVKEENGVRKIWGKEFKMKECENCGVYFATDEELEMIKRETNLPDDNPVFHYCLSCRPKVK